LKCGLLYTGAGAADKIAGLLSPGPKDFPQLKATGIEENTGGGGSILTFGEVSGGIDS
jgi:hypothetical protein